MNKRNSILCLIAVIGVLLVARNIATAQLTLISQTPNAVENLLALASDDYAWLGTTTSLYVIDKSDQYFEILYDNPRPSMRITSAGVVGPGNTIFFHVQVAPETRWHQLWAANLTHAWFVAHTPEIYSYSDVLAVYNNETYFAGRDPSRPDSEIMLMATNGVQTRLRSPGSIATWTVGVSGDLLPHNMDDFFVNPFDGRLWFIVTDVIHGMEIWATDGATAQLVIETAPGPRSLIPSRIAYINPGNFTIFMTLGESPTAKLWGYNGATLLNIRNMTTPNSGLLYKGCAAIYVAQNFINVDIGSTSDSSFTSLPGAIYFSGLITAFAPGSLNSATYGRVRPYPSICQATTATHFHLLRLSEAPFSTRRHDSQMAVLPVSSVLINTLAFPTPPNQNFYDRPSGRPIPGFSREISAHCSRAPPGVVPTNVTYVSRVNNTDAVFHICRRGSGGCSPRKSWPLGPVTFNALFAVFKSDPYEDTLAFIAPDSKIYISSPQNGYVPTATTRTARVVPPDPFSITALPQVLGSNPQLFFAKNATLTNVVKFNSDSSATFLLASGYRIDPNPALRTVATCSASTCVMVLLQSSSANATFVSFDRATETWTFIPEAHLTPADLSESVWILSDPTSDTRFAFSARNSSGGGSIFVWNDSQLLRLSFDSESPCIDACSPRLITSIGYLIFASDRGRVVRVQLSQLATTEASFPSVSVQSPFVQNSPGQVTYMDSSSVTVWTVSDQTGPATTAPPFNPGNNPSFVVLQTLQAVAAVSAVTNELGILSSLNPSVARGLRLAPGGDVRSYTLCGSVPSRAIVGADDVLLLAERFNFTYTLVLVTLTETGTTSAELPLPSQFNVFCSSDDKRSNILVSTPERVDVYFGAQTLVPIYDRLSDASAALFTLDTRNPILSTSIESSTTRLIWTETNSDLYRQTSRTLSVTINTCASALNCTFEDQTCSVNGICLPLNPAGASRLRPSPPSVAPLSANTCGGQPSVATGRWIISGTVVIGANSDLADAPLLSVVSPIEIRGDLVILTPVSPQTVTVTVSPGATINVTGCATFAGTLSLQLSSAQTSQPQSSIDILTFGGYCNATETQFAGVTVNGTSACQRVSTQPQYSARSLSVLITVDSSACESAVSGGNAAAIGAGVGVPLALIVIGAIIAIVIVRRRSRNQEIDEIEAIELGDKKPKATVTSEKKSKADTTEYTAINADDDAHPSSADFVSIAAEDVRILHKLGSGAYGEVSLGQMPDGKFVAVKKLSKAVLAARVQDFFAEANIMLQLETHINVVDTYGIIVDSGFYGLVMEFCPRGSLDVELHRRLNLKRNEIATKDDRNVLLGPDFFNTVYGIVCGMETLAGSSIIHRDLSARNVLLDNNGIAKIADFGYARRVGEEQVGKTETSIGPIRWMSPENLRDRIYSEASDVWAFGATLYEILTGQIPYSTFEGSLADLAIQIRDNALTPLSDLQSVMKKQGLRAPDGLLDVLKSCFAQEPSTRPTFEQLREQLEQLDPVSFVAYMNMTDSLDSVKSEDIPTQPPTAPINNQQGNYTEFGGTLGKSSKSQKRRSTKGTYRKSLRSGGGKSDVVGLETSDLDGLKTLSKLGEGSFGAVFLGQLDGTYVAIKKLLLENDLTQTLSPREKKKRDAAMYMEASIMAKIKPHKNVIRIYGLAKDAESMSIVMEFAARGSLETFISRNEQIPEAIVFRLAIGIARGMASLADQHVIHRDLAARNVLLDSTLEPKISDFGLSRSVDSTVDSGKTSSNVGPIRWMAPENIAALTYSEKSDVWSYGGVLVELLSRAVPYGEKTDIVDIIVGVRDQNWNPLMFPRRVGREAREPSWVASAPTYLVELMRKCFAKNPSDRPSFDKIVIFLLENIPEKVARAEARRDKRVKKREKILAALDEIVV